MEPSSFPQANGTLLGGPATKYGTEADVEDLPVYRGGGEIISCWRPTLRDRLSILFRGQVWLRVLSVSSHPAVSIEAGRVFE